VWRRLDVCDEPECVAPGHLTLLCPARQRPPKARQVRAALAPEVVVRIRELAAHVPQRDISRSFGLDPSVVSRIVKGKSYRDIRVRG